MLRILQSSIDGQTGHISHLIRVEEETAPGQTSLGPEETVCIWPRALMLAYHPADLPPTKESIAAAHDKWLETCYMAALDRKRHLEMVSHVVHGSKGRLIDFGSKVAR